jgi:hypothetical protein
MVLTAAVCSGCGSMRIDDPGTAILSDAATVPEPASLLLLAPGLLLLYRRKWS